MSLLPSFAQRTIVTQTEEQLDLSRSLYEFGVDFSNGQFTGRMVNGREAVKVWIWKCLMTSRFKFPIYTWLYGSELEEYIGRALTQEYIDTDVKLALQDALLINPEINAIRDYSGRMDGDILRISFTAETIFGQISILDYEVNGYKSPADRAVEFAITAIRAGLIKFRIIDGHLILQIMDTAEKAVLFRLDSKGYLVADMSEKFSEHVDMKIIGTTGQLEAVINV